MSQNQGLPDGQQAYQALYEGVHAEVFFQKCAAAGIVPRTIEDANHMLDDALRLRGLEGQQKQAEAVDSPFAALHTSLGHVLEANGFGGVKQAEEEQAINQMAAHLAQDPLYYNSVLALKAAEAEEIAQHYQGQRQRVAA